MPYLPSTREALDDVKKHTILTLIASGCSQRSAAQYIGCSPSTITRTADRDQDFNVALANAHQMAELKLLRQIQTAGSDPKHWRAAAWLLERHNPVDFTIHPKMISKDRMEQIFTEMVDLLQEDVPLENVDRAAKRLRFMLYEQGIRHPCSCDQEEFDNMDQPENFDFPNLCELHPDDADDAGDTDSVDDTVDTDTAGDAGATGASNAEPSENTAIDESDQVFPDFNIPREIL